ncbi:MAG: biotin/lipoyl-containing protein, partial [Micromonosporaceae bacterium]
HQKVIEESGSTALDAATEREIQDAAIRLMSTAGYRNAGTVEFLVAPETGQFMFMEVNTRLQVEHPVTEESTGLDLVKLQLHVAAGGRLIGQPPSVRSYAVEARLCAEDPEHGFTPAPGRLAVLTTPTGAGIRVETGVRAGDVITPEFDSMIAKVIASGRDRAEALSRLRRALAQTEVVVEGGTTNRSFLLALLDRPEVLAGKVDNHWLDRLTADGHHLPAPDPVALLVTAVEAYEADAAAARTVFHSQAARGRPELPAEIGHSCVLKYRGSRYPLRVFRTGSKSYRVDTTGGLADMVVERADGYQRQVVVGGRRHRVAVVADGPAFRVDVDGAAHTVTRDDGGVVRCGWPAFVVAVRVQPGDVVAEGDPLLVLESMKMEAIVAAPYGGIVSTVEVTPNAQVEAGAPLLQIRASADDEPEIDKSARVKLGGLATPEPAGTLPCERVYGALCGYLLGYDLDPMTVRELFARQRWISGSARPTDTTLAQCEDGLLDLFADVASLYRPRTGSAWEATGDTPQEFLLSYLQWLDPDRAGLPNGFRRRLEAALRRYGVSGLERTPDLEDAVVWMFRSFSRVGELVGVVTGILERRLRSRAELRLAAAVDAAQLRRRMDRLAAATQGRHQVVADLARDVRFRFLDEPLLVSVAEAEHSVVETRLAELHADPAGADRPAHVERLVRSPQPLRGALLRHWRRRQGRRFREALLEVYTRRYYRTRELGPLHFTRRPKQLLCTTDYDVADKRIHLVTGCAKLTDLPALSHTVSRHLATSADPTREVVVDLLTWRAGPRLEFDAFAAEVAELLRSCRFGRPLRRLDITATSVKGRLAEHRRTQHLTFRQIEGADLIEDPFYRNLHPMLAKRLDLWRLSNFALERLDSTEDVYLFHGVAHDNPADHRLFALAEVRDLTPAFDAVGTVSYPWLELIGLEALAAIRDALGRFPTHDRPAANRIVLYVRPPWTLSRRDWAVLARSFAPLAVGASLEKVVLRVQLPVDGTLQDAVLHVEGLGQRGVTVHERPLGTNPIRPLTAYRQKVLRAQRFGAPYPYEIVRMLAPPPGVLGRFPTGRFHEYDLDSTGALVPVDRP